VNVPAGWSAAEVLELFLDLVRIASPSGRERTLAEHVTALLEARGLTVAEDDTSAATGANVGNLLVHVPGRGGGVPILLCAHLDTVAVDAPIEPLVEDGVVRTLGATILGADDKVALAALVALLTDLAERPPQADVDVLFTVCEEVGLLGAAAFDMAPLAARAGFVMDSSGPLGAIVVSAPAQRRVTAEFRGTAAHAGLEPEQGHSAILAASRAVSTMKLGRIDEQTTANIGVIGGGVATNIVPERCELSGEVRSRDPQCLADQLAHMIGAIHFAAAEVGVDVAVEVAANYDGFALTGDALPSRLAARALSAQGIEPRFVGAGGGSDANIFNARGLPSVNLSAGFERVHSADEFVPVERLMQAYYVVHGLVAAAAAEPAS
jgi:tripeptide aminopeptidase